MTLAMVLTVIALILFILAALNIPSPVALGWLGMACYVGSKLAGGL